MIYILINIQDILPGLIYSSPKLEKIRLYFQRQPCDIDFGYVQMLLTQGNSLQFVRTCAVRVVFYTPEPLLTALSADIPKHWKNNEVRLEGTSKYPLMGL